MLIYLAELIIFTLGLFLLLTSENYIRKLLGIGILQNSIILFFLSLSKIKDGITPIVNDEYNIYTNPVPQVLMLTAIVVGFATLALGMTLVYKIAQRFGTINENQLDKLYHDSSRNH
jgi:multicomponent Na+:H+ antiporter subunit C